MQATKCVAEWNLIPADGGAYVLVLQLRRPRVLKWNRSGARTKFPPGWYLYIGSALGSGGIAARTARHIRRLGDNKKPHWHIDYFREAADLHEVWWSRTSDPATEHELAQAIASFSGSSVPAAGFGASDCGSNCESHFFQFARRPYTAELRASWKGKMLGTQFVTDHHDATSVSPLVAEYNLGRRLLELKRVAAERDGRNWTSFAKETPLRVLAESTARHLCVPFTHLKSAFEFARSVDTISENCGSDTLPMLLDQERPQSRKAIMQLSRTSDVRQRYRVELVMAGKARSVAPQNSDTVFDTVSFGEVLSRLGRARGSLTKLLESLSSSTDEAVSAKCRRLAELANRAGEQLQTFLVGDSDPTFDIPDELTKNSVLSGISDGETSGRLVGLAKQALRLTVKCVWDYPEMCRRSIVPSDVQRARAEQQVTALLSVSQSIASGVAGQL